MSDLAFLAWVLIPARGGSKGIPRKNLKKIQGRTLIARAVNASCSALRVSRVFVSTDDAAIAIEAKWAGAETVVRPENIADDTSSSEDALLHALEELEHSGEALPEIIAFVQCTSPFVNADDIDATIARLLETGADTAHTVAPAHSFLWRDRPDGGAEGINHDKRVRARRQDREPEFVETGAVYAMRTSGFREARHRFFGRSVFHVVPSLRSIEIDAPEDLSIARLLAPLVDPVVQASVIPNSLAAVIFDFDGVMTDDRVIQDANGTEAVTCSRSDGFGIEELHARNIRMAVISREQNLVVMQRCKKLGLECLQASDDKPRALKAFCEKWDIPLSAAIYVGNDTPDIACMELVALGVAVADARAEVRASAGLILSRRGGHGAVREICDLVLERLKSNP